jgi:hypothetical protein
MDVLDREVDEETRWAIMEACGRRCIGAGTLEKTGRLQQRAQDLDNLLGRLNEAHIGGGHLQRAGDVIHAAYDRCYCGSVSRTREPLSARTATAPAAGTGSSSRRSWAGRLKSNSWVQSSRAMSAANF